MQNKIRQESPIIHTSRTDYLTQFHVNSFQVGNSQDDVLTDWLRRFDNWLELQKALFPGPQELSQAVQCWSFVQHLGTEGRRHFMAYFKDDVPTALDTDYVLLHAVLSTIFAESPDVHAARDCFFWRKQAPVESSADFASALRALIKDCIFGGMEDELLAIQFNSGRCSRDDTCDEQKSFISENSAKSTFSVQSMASVTSACVVGSVLSESSISVAVQTEPSIFSVLLTCSATQTDSISSRITERTRNNYTQTNPVSVLVSQCSQTEPENEPEKCPVQPAQMPSLTAENDCLECNNFSSTDWHEQVHRSSSASGSNRCTEQESIAGPLVHSKETTHRQGRKREMGQFPKGKRSKWAQPK